MNHYGDVYFKVINDRKEGVDGVVFRKAAENVVFSEWVNKTDDFIRDDSYGIGYYDFMNEYAKRDQKISGIFIQNGVNKDVVLQHLKSRFGSETTMIEEVLQAA